MECGSNMDQNDLKVHLKYQMINRIFLKNYVTKRKYKFKNNEFYNQYIAIWQDIANLGQKKQSNNNRGHTTCVVNAIAAWTIRRKW